MALRPVIVSRQVHTRTRSTQYADHPPARFSFHLRLRELTLPIHPEVPLASKIHTSGILENHPLTSAPPYPLHQVHQLITIGALSARTSHSLHATAGRGI